VCGSISSDADDQCGVCGASLLDVRSTDKNLEQIELETDVKEKAEDQRLDHEQRGRLHRGAIVGLLSGIILTLLGGWLFIFGFVGGVLVPAPNGYSSIVGLFMLVLGLTTLESVFGLFTGAPYHGLLWYGWVRVAREKEELARP
jgi:hypothetical protein